MLIDFIVKQKGFGNQDAICDCNDGSGSYKSVKENHKKGKIKNLVLFGIFSICSCYIHYYALITTCLINLLLLIFVIKNRKSNKEALRNFLILAGVQVLLYIPWLLYLLGQIVHVHNGFWIALDPISTPVELLSFQFRRQLDTNFVFDAHTIIALISSLVLYIYLGIRTYKYNKEKANLLPAKLSFGVYVGVIGLMLLISLIIFRPVLFSRYLFVMTGLYIFTIAYLLGFEKNKIIIGVTLAAIVILGTISNITNIKLYSNQENISVYDYIGEEIKDGDIMVFSDIGVGGVISSVFPDNKQYFLCDPTWDVEEAYKAYAPGMVIMNNLENGRNWSFLEGYTGRIWLVDNSGMGIANEFPMENTKVIKECKKFYTSYHEYSYGIVLLEKF